jgi:hypothetical protein
VNYASQSVSLFAGEWLNPFKKIMDKENSYFHGNQPDNDPLQYS